jgi:uncharacterized membrane protein
MARIAEFSSANIARFLLGVFIAVMLVLAVGVWFFYSPGQGTSIEKTQPQANPNQ